MQFLSSIQIPNLQPPITYHDKLLLVGSCFTEHIGNHLADVKFNVLQNPHGILFDPLSVCRSITSYINNEQYTEQDVFYLNEAWHSWQHHSRFSGVDKQQVLNNINAQQQQAHHFLKQANWVIITLGSAFAYQLVDEKLFVANCHKAPAQVFNKHFCTIDEIIIALDTLVYKLAQFNPYAQILFTVSPVRHLREGVVNNNRSKARLIEAVHHLANKFDKIHYFPAYELVVDVLRDYRFFDIDLAHPNYAATQFVLEHFTNSCIHENEHALMEQLKKIHIAKNHKPFNPTSTQHLQFLQQQLQKIQQLQQQHTYLNFEMEKVFFEEGLKAAM
jgi:hypothetical protein